MNLILIIFTLCYLPVFIVWHTIKYLFGPIYGIQVLDELFGQYRVSVANIKQNNKKKSKH
jgi:hypothetical protein